MTKSKSYAQKNIYSTSHTKQTIVNRVLSTIVVTNNERFASNYMIQHHTSRRQCHKDCVQLLVVKKDKRFADNDIISTSHTKKAIVIRIVFNYCTVTKNQSFGENDMIEHHIPKRQLARRLFINYCIDK